MIAITVPDSIESQDRETLWEVCCSSYPHIVMNDDCDIELREWRVSRGDHTTDDEYRDERVTLRDCIYNLGFCIDNCESDSWHIT